MTTLRVSEAYNRDVNRRIIRIDYSTMSKLKVEMGDYVVVIKKPNEVCLRVLPIYPSDDDKNICRIDDPSRKTLGVKVGDRVKITKAQVKQAINVEVEFLSEPISIDERYLNDSLDTMPVKNGSIVQIPYFGTLSKLRVIRTDPEGFVVIKNNTTKFTIKTPNQDPVDESTCPTCGCNKEVARRWVLVDNILRSASKTNWGDRKSIDNFAEFLFNVLGKELDSKTTKY